jgi:hypothetical protein
MKLLYLVSFLLLSIFSFAGNECMLYPVSLGARVQNSDLIIEGKVISQSSYWDEDHKHIYTCNRVEIYKIFKGSWQDTILNVITEGGTVGFERHEHTSTLTLDPGLQGIFFCELSTLLPGKTSFTIYSSMQGFIRYNLADFTAHEPFKDYSGITTGLYSEIQKLTSQSFRQIKNNIGLIPSSKSSFRLGRLAAVPVLTNFTPTTITAGTGSILTINGSNFNAVQGTGFVEFKNSHDGGATFIKPMASDYISWTDTQIQLKVPTVGATSLCAGTGQIRVTNSDPNTVTSAGTLTVSYAYSNVNSGGIAQLPDHINKNGAGGYTFQLFTGFDANTAAKAAFTRALETWRCNTFINIDIGTTTTINVIASDGTNVVRFDIGAELPAGVLGRCTSYYSGLSCPGQVWWVNELDVAFDDGTQWNFGPGAPALADFDFESVAVHELGHGHQLNHIILPGAVMHYAIANGQSQRVLSAANDIAGGNFVMTKSTVANACGPGPMLALSAGTCVLSVDFVAFYGLHNNNVNSLYWETSQEINNNKFIVERSENGNDFVEIYELLTKNSTSGAKYQYNDANAKQNYYYRIVTADQNNFRTYSQVIQIMADILNPGIEIYFNTNKSLTILAKNFNLNDSDLILYNGCGQIIYKTRISENTITATTESLAQIPAGIYFYKFISRTNIFSGKLFTE